MQRLVCDVGGTNARLGLAAQGVLNSGSVRSFSNDDFGDFEDILRTYVADLKPKTVTEIAIAVAGPVSGRHARLTNREWPFDADKLEHEFGARVVLINDLSALGASLSQLEGNDLSEISGVSGQFNGQKLVIGIGTGFNVSPVIERGGAAICPEVEFGHVSLHTDIVAQVAEWVPGISFSTVEELFSGRGYTAFAQAGGTTEQYGEAMAILAGNLLMAFLPRDGIYFAGGVARHVLQAGGRAGFARRWAQPRQLGLGAAVWCIQDDAAALKGCAQYSFPPQAADL